VYQSSSWCLWESVAAFFPGVTPSDIIIRVIEWLKSAIRDEESVLKPIGFTSVFAQYRLIALELGLRGGLSKKRTRSSIIYDDEKLSHSIWGETLDILAIASIFGVAIITVTPQQLYLVHLGDTGQLALKDNRLSERTHTLALVLAHPTAHFCPTSNIDAARCDPPDMPTVASLRLNFVNSRKSVTIQDEGVDIEYLVLD
jgi:hypothetical protein